MNLVCAQSSEIWVSWYPAPRLSCGWIFRTAPSMQVYDARNVECGTVLDTDLAIVGTGPAGLSLAREFFDTGVRIVLLERGGMRESIEVAPSEEFESSGAPRFKNPRRVRNHGFGGSSQTWSGKCRTFDDIDFERRPWVPHSGWPISKADLAPYEDRTAALMHLGPNTYDSGLWHLLGCRQPLLQGCPGTLEPCFWQYSRDPDQPWEFLRFGPQFLKHQPKNVQIFLNAAVTRIDTLENGRLTSLEVTTAPGLTFTVAPKATVLAAGGIENARLLLNSNRVQPAGLGNEYDVVGRFLMDHPRTSLGEFRGEAAQTIQERFGLYRLKHAGGACFYSNGVALSPVLQRRKRLLNCAAYFSEYRSDDDPWDAIKRLYRRQSRDYLKDVLSAVSHPDLLLSGLYQRTIKGRNVHHRIDKLAVDCLVEQVPDPDSRVTLSDRRDELGQPIAHVHWKISDLERQSVAALAEVFASEISRVGLQPPIPPDWLRERQLEAMRFTDTAHPTGTTRMANDPRQGVVDWNCRLHGADGIFVAGSSVFPTASHSNPTLMIVAMTLRLADWLKQRQFA